MTLGSLQNEAANWTISTDLPMLREFIVNLDTSKAAWRGLWGLPGSRRCLVLEPMKSGLSQG